MSTLHRRRLSSGLDLIVEPMAHIRSAAVSLLVPGGTVSQDPARQGVANVLAEMLERGAGGLSSHAHSDALDRLGVQRGTSCGTTHLAMNARLLAEHLPAALPLLLDILVRPNLDVSEFEPSRELTLREFDALRDDPAQRTFVRLRQNHFPAPLGWHPLGDVAALTQLTIDDVRSHHARHCRPDGAVLSIVGPVDPSQVEAQVIAALGDWSGKAPETPSLTPARRGEDFEAADTSQVQIALACDAVPGNHPERHLWAALGMLLSGGPSARLFTEVREKRGLCYAVSASYSGLRQVGALLAYVGTTPARQMEARETLECELARTQQGLTQPEFDRILIGLKSGLVMHGESAGSRASALAADQVLLGYPRTLEERLAKIAGMTHAEVNAFLARTPLTVASAVTLGPAPTVAAKEGV